MLIAILFVNGTITAKKVPDDMTLEDCKKDAGNRIHGSIFKIVDEYGAGLWSRYEVRSNGYGSKGCFIDKN